MDAATTERVAVNANYTPVFAAPSGKTPQGVD